MISHAGPGDGTDAPETVNVMDIREQEQSHGSPRGESGTIVLWDGKEYDSKEGSWIQCPDEMLCDLSTWH